LARSLAILASIFVVATPIDATSPVSSLTRSRTDRAIVGPSPWSRRAPRTSRNASSREIGSTSGVIDRRMPITSRLAAPYASNRGERNTPSGHARRARAIGIAENTPN